VFWLGELPHYTLFTTENGTSLERIKNNKVRLRFPTSKGFTSALFFVLFMSGKRVSLRSLRLMLVVRQAN
jgi:hypothetical protein